MKLGFAAYSNKNGILSTRDGLFSVAASAGLDCVTYSSAADVSADKIKPDILVVMGGDGSLLKYADIASLENIPILGVNLGRIGFLSEIKEAEFEDVLARLVRGDYSIDERMMLCCSINDTNAWYCLNDIVVFKRTFSGIAQIELSIDNIHINTVYCDGLIVATPTGSTAYSLSAGGPVIDQALEAILVTPVCSHTLNMRPFVAARDAHIAVKLAGKGLVSVDGTQVWQASSEDQIIITYAERKTRFIRLSQTNIFELIRSKLS